MSRLVDADHYVGNTLTNSFVEKNITYDKNTNLLTLKRYNNGALTDNLNFSYLGNRRVGYNCDLNGNITNDADNDIELEYNFNNQLKKVRLGDSSYVNYSYLADGTKIAATDSNGNGLCYRGSFVYKQSGETISLSEALFSSGRIVANTVNGAVTYSPQYFITDHLGSVRVVIDADGEIIERNDYFPYGKRWQETDVELNLNRYRYNGKEDQTFVNIPYLDYGARMYDGLRWTGIDKLAEEYYSFSPYAYCAGNPVRYTDFDGQQIIDPQALAKMLEHYGISHNIKTLGYAMGNPLNAIKVGYASAKWDCISKTASNFQVNIGHIASCEEFNDGKKGGMGNAYRHVLWQAIITRDIGKDHAVRIGNAHEDTNSNDPDTSVDIKNNEIGRNIGSQHINATNQEMAQKVLYEFLQNGFWTVNDKNEEIKTQITEVQYNAALEEILKKDENGLNKKIQ